MSEAKFIANPKQPVINTLRHKCDGRSYLIWNTLFSYREHLSSEEYLEVPHALKRFPFDCRYENHAYIRLGNPHLKPYYSVLMIESIFSEN